MAYDGICIHSIYGDMCASVIICGMCVCVLQLKALRLCLYVYVICAQQSPPAASNWMSQPAAPSAAELESLNCACESRQTPRSQRSPDTSDLSKSQ